MSYRVRNISQAPQGVHTLDRGLVFIRAGEERAIEPADLGRLRSLPFFELKEIDVRLPEPSPEIAASIAKFDHDGDGRIGGSKPRTTATKRPAKRRKRRTKAKP